MVKLQIVLVCLAVAAAGPMGNIFSNSASELPTAECVLTVGDEGITGSIKFTELNPEEVEIKGTVSGLT